ncbi:MAG: hypothetical protein U1A24_16545 [Cypionkella sp.]|uniref:hypothetical protein n=1 Tax=Cypionkella sp. TaxID=2811411 RepID=UPI002ABBD4BB|nr:hypothetical protein [Cypionkella sp.]MDZ4312159.1 hypothetical protein [Cypionkella sp.]MDZ4392085.1 hypothetical protein [Cypionkella sp.]
MKSFVEGCMVAIALALATGAASAKPVIYNCKPVIGRSDSVIQPEYVISYDKASGEVLVNDPIIMSTVGKPIQGKLQSESDVRAVFDWRLKSLKGPTNTTSWQYRARVFKDGRLSMTVTPVGYDNHFSSEGRCTVSK